MVNVKNIPIEPVATMPNLAPTVETKPNDVVQLEAPSLPKSVPDVVQPEPSPPQIPQYEEDNIEEAPAPQPIIRRPKNQVVQKPAPRPIHRGLLFKHSLRIPPQ